ncbi:MAG: DUF2793 domain-containing protein [Proteobacteria bacterium]|nr:DUF2793 domain-containing protein [Pseudomonadota bacterium]
MKNNNITEMNFSMLEQYQAHKEIVVNENFQKISLLIGKNAAQSKKQDIGEKEIKSIHSGNLFIVPEQTERYKELKHYIAAASQYSKSIFFIKPQIGMSIWIIDESSIAIFNGKEWQ